MACLRQAHLLLLLLLVAALLTRGLLELLLAVLICHCCVTHNMPLPQECQPSVQ
jgi:hypothetical protein